MKIGRFVEAKYLKGKEIQKVENPKIKSKRTFRKRKEEGSDEGEVREEAN